MLMLISVQSYGLEFNRITLIDTATCNMLFCGTISQLSDYREVRALAIQLYRLLICRNSFATRHDAAFKVTLIRLQSDVDQRINLLHERDATTCDFTDWPDVRYPLVGTFDRYISIFHVVKV